MRNHTNVPLVAVQESRHKDMEFKMMAFVLLFSLLFFLILLLNQTFRKRSRRAPPPPGPWRVPLIGSLHHLIGSPLHLALRDIASKHGPVVLLRLGQTTTTLISSPEAVEAVMKTHDANFCNRPLTSAPKALLYEGIGVTFSPYSAQWRQNRRICATELLTSRRVKSFSSIIQEEISDLLRKISSLSRSGSPVNLSKEFLSHSNKIIAKTTFGKECKQSDRFVSAMKESMELGVAPCVADLFPWLSFVDVLTGMRAKLRRLHRQFDDVLDEIIRDSDEAEDGADETFLDVLKRLQKKSDNLEVPLTHIHVKALLLDMFIGGTDTAAIVADWAMSELVKNPEVMHRAQTEVRKVLKGKTKMEESDINELQYLMLVVKETLRLHPPLPLLTPRLSKEACQVLGYEVPASSTVIINLWTILRDPKYWDDAEKFKPERFEGNSIEFKGTHFEFTPFGAGRRMCPGILFGVSNVMHSLAQLLCHFDWELPDGVQPRDLDMTESFGATMCRKSDLLVIAKRHIHPTPLL